MRRQASNEATSLRRVNARDVSLAGIPNIGKATLIGALLGAVSVAVPVIVVLVSFGGGPMSIVGAHVGFFGGMGFGGMLGAVIRSDRWERATKEKVQIG